MKNMGHRYSKDGKIVAIQLFNKLGHYILPAMPAGIKHLSVVEAQCSCGSVGGISTEPVKLLSSELMLSAVLLRQMDFIPGIVSFKVRAVTVLRSAYTPFQLFVLIPKSKPYDDYHRVRKFRTR